MKVNLIKGPFLDKNIQRTYQYLLDLYREEKMTKNDSNLREGIDRRAIKGVQRRRTD